VTFAVAANTGSAARTGTITVGGQAFRVTQIGMDVSTAAAQGFFDTPLGIATESGSIAVTGWAVSQAGIDRVEIWRDLAVGETTVPFRSPGHPADGKVFIAQAAFVKGARPDVAGLYPTYPNSDRAGWGYLMLTQGLWNQGNGTFTLYALAYEANGRVTPLCTALEPFLVGGHFTMLQCASWSRTIAVDNAGATKPFGSIDTPAYGETRSGGFWNFGWALTPNPNATDPRTCTIANGNVWMSIDSQPLTPVHYGDTRTDIASAFSGFSNGSSAGGSFYIDTTALGNGDHTIGWYVVDNCDRADGVGGRFFTVLNGANITTEAPPLVGARALAAAGDDAPLLLRQDGTARASFANDGGVHMIRIAQRSRIEVDLPAIAAPDRYRGAEIVNGIEKPLPLGSSLDRERAVFYWEPAPAFLGSYDLIFVSGVREPVRIRVVIEP
jgi:hypothetical protein